MGIRITQNQMYDTMTSQMQKNLSAYMESNEAGLYPKINRPSDDPAGTYRVLTTRNDIEATDQYQSNVDTAQGWLSLTDNVLGTRSSATPLQPEKPCRAGLHRYLHGGKPPADCLSGTADFGEMLNLSNTQYEGNSIFG